MKVFRKFLLVPIIVFSAILILKKIFDIYPDFLDLVYRGFIFPAIRYVYDYSIGFWLPIPMVWISFAIIFYFIFIKKYKHKNLKSLLAQIFGHVLIVFSLFYLLWGWNYSQRSIAERMDLTLQAVDTISLFAEAEWLVQELNESRSALQNDSLALVDTFGNRKSIEKDVRAVLSKTLDDIGYKSYGRPRVRVLAPKGVLLRFKTAGIYMPYAFEGHIDGGLLQLEWPYTMAHEMSHAYGITDEGECNFTAYLACMSSEDPYFRYSALIDYGLYLMRDVYKASKVEHKAIFSKLHPGFKADLKAMRQNHTKYPDILPSLRDFMYDSYLKSNGVKAGLRSYSQLVGLIIAYKQKESFN